MELEQYFEETMAPNDYNGERKSCLEKWQQSDTTSVSSSDDNTSSGFDCNICLDSVQEPVVTLCGHLFCWPCIYKWLHFQSSSSENEDEQQLQCPVCKAEVSQATLVPLYGRSQNTKSPKGKSPSLGLVIPRRPLGPICGIDTPRSPASTYTSPRITQHQLHHHHQSYSQQAQPYYQHLGSYTTSSTLNMGGIAANVSHPIIGMFGEMVYARVFGNSVTNLYSNSYHLAGTSSSRVRRHVMQADRSLSRICFFLFCCVMLCLLLF